MSAFWLSPILLSVVALNWLPTRCAPWRIYTIASTACLYPRRCQYSGYIPTTWPTTSGLICPSCKWATTSWTTRITVATRTWEQLVEALALQCDCLRTCHSACCSCRPKRATSTARSAIVTQQWRMHTVSAAAIVPLRTDRPTDTAACAICVWSLITCTVPSVVAVANARVTAASCINLSNVVGSVVNVVTSKPVVSSGCDSRKVQNEGNETLRASSVLERVIANGTANCDAST